MTSSNDMIAIASRFVAGIKRCRAGLSLQRERIRQRNAQAPRLHPGTPYEVTDFSGLPENDFDYYAYELGRLRCIAKEITEHFDEPGVVTSALNEFDRKLPHVARVRNPLTHIDGRSRADRFVAFSALVELGAFGDVDYLLDPTSVAEQRAIEDLSEAMLAFLRQALREA